VRARSGHCDDAGIHWSTTLDHHGCSFLRANTSAPADLLRHTAAAAADDADDDDDDHGGCYDRTSVAADVLKSESVACEAQNIISE